MNMQTGYFSMRLSFGTRGEPPASDLRRNLVQSGQHLDAGKAMTAQCRTVATRPDPDGGGEHFTQLGKRVDHLRGVERARKR